RIDKYAPKFFVVVASVLMLLLMPFPALAQDTLPTPVLDESSIEAPERVDVQPVARDDEIERRLQDILIATGWFINPDVEVQDGVVFLNGQTETERFMAWAGDLARNTQDVAAVVNRIQVIEPDLLDFQPVINGLRDQIRFFLRSIPILGFSLIILAIAAAIGRFVARASRNYLRHQSVNILLMNLLSRVAGIIVFLGGLYLVFQVAGLTNIAFTILGGTGLLGLILGIAFRDITENFLASVFLSVQNPFNIGDLVEINDVMGFVQGMTTRTTILMTLAGNHVQIPNATVYKNIIHNYTSNPNRRVDFTIGIGYDDSISLAQETVREVLAGHPAILNDPEHLVLVDGLGSATVNLQIYFWLNGNEYSWLKVKSSVIRLVKRAIEDAGISMPDEAREMIFPQGVPVQMLDSGRDVSAVEKSQLSDEDDTVSTQAEGGLKSEADEIESQARQSRTPESGENLLVSEAPLQNQ
ncbi:MAG: mechanosensitive ion channel domain-containing protein, partial [Aggregatilineales bacterium]